MAVGLGLPFWLFLGWTPKKSLLVLVRPSALLKTRCPLTPSPLPQGARGAGLRGGDGDAQSALVTERFVGRRTFLVWTQKKSALF